MIDVERSSPGPASLARASGWAHEDVIAALHRDFLGKCYLCERELTLANLKVDHRWPRRLDPDRTRHFDWTNLFPACEHCNGQRPPYPEAGLLSPGDGIESRIEQIANPAVDGVECRFSSRDVADHAAVNTAAELEHLHTVKTGTTFRARLNTADLLAAIRLRYAQDVFPLEHEVRVLRRRRARKQAYAPADLRDAEVAFRRAVSRRAPYTMLIRSLVDPTLADLFD